MSVHMLPILHMVYMHGDPQACRPNPVFMLSCWRTLKAALCASCGEVRIVTDKTTFKYQMALMLLMVVSKLNEHKSVAPPSAN